MPLAAVVMPPIGDHCAAVYADASGSIGFSAWTVRDGEVLVMAGGWTRREMAELTIAELVKQLELLAYHLKISISTSTSAAGPGDRQGNTAEREPRVSRCEHPPHRGEALSKNLRRGAGDPTPSRQWSESGVPGISDAWQTPRRGNGPSPGATPSPPPMGGHTHQDGP